jgi:metallo beta-lactamase family protein
MDFRRNLFKLLLIFATIGLLYYLYDNNGGKIESNNAKYVSNGTRIHFVDVDQGDCTLVESNGEFMLIDGGESEYKEKVMKYLNEHSVENIKYLIATHPHSDHIGSLSYIVNNYKIDNIIMPNVAHTAPVYSHFINAVAGKGIKTYEPVVGDNYTVGDCSFTIIGPSKYDDNLNNSSVAIKLVHGNDNFIFAGDAEKSEENDIIATGIVLSADLYKVNHHGSSTSSSDNFLKAISPKYAVISCGKANEYGHPHEAVLNKLEDIGAKIYRTDQSGDIVVETTGSGLKIIKGFTSDSQISPAA